MNFELLELKALANDNKNETRKKNWVRFLSPPVHI